MEAKIGKLKTELAVIRNEAIAAHISGDRAKADCLTGKAVGMKSTIDLAEKCLREGDSQAVGELEGIEKVIRALGPLPHC